MPTKRPVQDRHPKTADVKRTARAAYQAEREHPRSVAVQPIEVVRAHYRRGLSPSTAARKMYLLLLHRALVAHAAGKWPERNEFKFTRAELRTSSHSSTDRIDLILQELAAMELTIETKLDGEDADRIEPILAYRVVTHSRRATASVVLAVSDGLRQIITSSNEYSRLHTEILRAIDNRYAVTMYAMGQLLVGRLKAPYESISVDDIRTRFGIADDAYSSVKDLRRLLEGAARAVTEIAPFQMIVEVERLSGGVLRLGGPKRGRGAAILAFRIYALPKDHALREAASPRTERVRVAMRPVLEAEERVQQELRAAQIRQRAVQQTKMVREAERREKHRQERSSSSYRPKGHETDGE